MEKLPQSQTDEVNNFDDTFEQPSEVSEAQIGMADDSQIEQETTQEKDSFFVRTKLGRLALKIVSDPIFAVNSLGWGLNTMANAHQPNLLNTTMAVATVAAGTIRAGMITHKHLSELEATENAHEQGSS